MTALDRLIPSARLLEIDRVDLAAPPPQVRERVRHGDLAQSPLERALFAVRTLGASDASLHVDDLVSTPERPGFQLLVDACERGRWFVVHGAADAATRTAGRPWVTVSWLFLVEPLGPTRSRLVSRYRVDCSGDLLTRLSFGPLLIEPIGFAMDRGMLLGVKARAEREVRALLARPASAGTSAAARPPIGC